MGQCCNRCAPGHRCKPHRPRLIRAGAGRARIVRRALGDPGECGSAYASLVQASEGRTGNEPHTLTWCNQNDVEAWHVQAAVVAKLVRRAWNELLGLENGAKNWSASQRLNPSVTNYENAQNALPGPSMWQVFGAGACTQSTAEHVAVIRDGACQLEQLNAAIEQLGGKPVDRPHVPPPEPSPWDKLTGGLGSGLALVAAVAVVALVLSSRKSSERQSVDR